MNRNNEATGWSRQSQSRAVGAKGGFTLIELLMVISIIGLLAALTVGLTGVASRKMRESRVQTELNSLVTLIENYRQALGFYPPDNRGQPSTNQLFYELSGTYFDNKKFLIPGRQKGLTPQQILAYFRADGLANSVRSGGELKFRESFKPSQYAEIQPKAAGDDVEVLTVPVPGDPNSKYAVVGKDGRTRLNPWLYDASSTNRNNIQGYDLWAEVLIGKKVVRFSNWEREPVVVKETP